MKELIGALYIAFAAALTHSGLLNLSLSLMYVAAAMGSGGLLPQGAWNQMLLHFVIAGVMAWFAWRLARAGKNRVFTAKQPAIQASA